MATDGNTPTTTEAVEAQIKALNAKARAGDFAALAGLKALLDNYPDIWQKRGDLALSAQAAWFSLATKQDPFGTECLERAAVARRAELAREGASPIELLLVDRAVACGVQVEYFSGLEAKAMGDQEPQRVLAYWAKRHVQAQRSFAAALADLTTIQNLLPAQNAPQATAQAATKASAMPGAAAAARSTAESSAKPTAASTAKSATETSAQPTAAAASESATKASGKRMAAAAAKSATKASAKPAMAMAAKRDPKPAPRKARRPRKAPPAAAEDVNTLIEPFLNGRVKDASERLVGVN